MPGTPVLTPRGMILDLSMNTIFSETFHNTAVYNPNDVSIWLCKTLIQLNVLPRQLPQSYIVFTWNENDWVFMASPEVFKYQATNLTKDAKTERF